MLIKQGIDKSDLKPEDKTQLENYKKHFSGNKAEAEEFVTLCINDPARAKQSALECNAATASLLSILDMNVENKKNETPVAVQLARSKSERRPGAG